jgi:predicted O-linked N-acetylglucosamine transferase (SPINDLY family)
MALPLPAPTPPRSTGVSSPPVRAYQRWQLGRRHAEQEQWPAAAAAFEQATRLHGDVAYPLAAAHALICAGRPEEALECARRIRKKYPLATTAYTLESHALLELGLPSEAAAHLRQLPTEAPRDHAYLTALAVSLQRCYRHDEAIPAFMDVLAARIDDPIAHFRLGMSFKDIGMKAQAAECVRTALMLSLDASALAALAQLVFLEREACNWAVADADLARLRQAVRDASPDVICETGVFQHAVLVDDAAEQLKVARLYALHAARGIPPLPRRAAGKRTERLRIGYLSTDFHTHATSQLMVQMLECHDRSAFEVTLFSAGPDDASAMRRRIMAASEHFEDLRGLDEKKMARRIQQLGIDILVDLKGATNDNRMRVLAYRAAPLQVNWLGFPGSTGAPFIDYMIGDPIVTPLADAANFSEKLAQLPHCYQPNDAHRAVPRPSTRAEWGVPEDALLLCGFHQSYKISAEVFGAWCELLKAEPRAKLWLLLWNANVQSTLIAAARAQGIDPERLLFSPLLPLEHHLSRLAHADVFLDAWPCNAHTTAGEALWAGVPVVTRIGQTFAQRVAASLLHAVQLDELVCEGAQSYHDQVLALLRDPARRAQLREHLMAQRSSSSLFDGALFARDIEALYQRMWARAAAGQLPEHLPAA